MGKIIYSHKLEYELNELVVILYYKQYFGFKKDAIEYVQHIRDFIDTISTRPIKLCKSPKYGKYYARYDNKKSNMQYFITYDTMDEIYYIEDIISPKTKEYSFIISPK